MNYFSDCHTPNDVKALYKTLAQEHHPDVSGYDSTRIMQDINAAYLIALQNLHKYETRSSSNGKSHTYYYNEERERASMNIVETLIKAKFSQAVTIELLGSWVWVSGIARGSDDMEIHKSLKHPTIKRKDNTPASLLKWHSKRELFYWSPPNSHSKYNARASFQDLRYTYGSQAFKSDQERERKQSPNNPRLSQA